MDKAHASTKDVRHLSFSSYFTIAWTLRMKGLDAKPTSGEFWLCMCFYLSEYTRTREAAKFHLCATNKFKSVRLSNRRSIVQVYSGGVAKLGDQRLVDGTFHVENAVQFHEIHTSIFKRTGHVKSISFWHLGKWLLGGLGRNWVKYRGLKCHYFCASR